MLSIKLMMIILVLKEFEKPEDFSVTWLNVDNILSVKQK